MRAALGGTNRRTNRVLPDDAPLSFGGARERFETCYKLNDGRRKQRIFSHTIRGKQVGRLCGSFSFTLLLSTLTGGRSGEIKTELLGGRRGNCIDNARVAGDRAVSARNPAARHPGPTSGHYYPVCTDRDDDGVRAREIYLPQRSRESCWKPDARDRVIILAPRHVRTSLARV